MKYAIMVGNPINGFELHGAFNSEEAASEWAESADFKEVWWTVPVNPIPDIDDFDDDEDDDDILPDTPITPVVSARSH
jgi:hypothetical protein